MTQEHKIGKHSSGKHGGHAPGDQNQGVAQPAGTDPEPVLGPRPEPGTEAERIQEQQERERQGAGHRSRRH